MLAACLHAWHVEHHEIAPRRERHRALELAHSQTAADVGHARQSVQRHPFHPRRLQRRVTCHASIHRRATIRLDIAHDARRIAHHDRIRRHRARHHCPRPNHRVLPNAQPRQDRAARTQRGPGRNMRGQRRCQILATARKLVVGKCNVGADEDVILDPQPIPQLHPALDRDTIADHDIVLDQYMCTDVAVAADPGPGQHHDVLPDARSRTDVGTLDISQRVDACVVVHAYPFGLSRCQRQVSAHIASMPRLADQPSTCMARVGSAHSAATSPGRRATTS